MGIAFVKINDLELVSEFGLGSLPTLVYYRHTTPIVYEGTKTNKDKTLGNVVLWLSGDVTDEGKVLDWLISNRNVGDDSERLEEVTIVALEGMTSTKDGIVVLFCEFSTNFPNFPIALYQFYLKQYPYFQIFASYL